jgi:GNAT superfamily N-acetyltransferase
MGIRDLESNIDLEIESLGPISVLVDNMSPIDFYESNGFLWVQWIFMSPINFYESNGFFMGPIKNLFKKIVKALGLGHRLRP